MVDKNNQISGAQDKDFPAPLRPTELRATPVTDKLVEHHAWDDKNHPATDWVPAERARQMERCINRMKSVIAEYENIILP